MIKVFTFIVILLIACRENNKITILEPIILTLKRSRSSMQVNELYVKTHVNVGNLEIFIQIKTIKSFGFTKINMKSVYKSGKSTMVILTLYIYTMIYISELNVKFIASIISVGNQIILRKIT